MRIALQAVNAIGMMTCCHSANPPPPIPFNKSEQPMPKKATCTEFKLYSRPDDQDSNTYNLDIHHFKSSTPVEWIETLKDINQVLHGSRIENSEASAAIVKMILKVGARHNYPMAATGAKSPKGAQNMANMPTKFSKYCELHGPGTHTTGKCKVLLAQVGKMNSRHTRLKWIYMPSSI